MLQCWSDDVKKRPQMSDIRLDIENWIRNPEILVEVGNAAHVLVCYL